MKLSYLKYYIILAHKQPQQLKRLVEGLDDKESFFVIHVDKKENLNLFKENLSKRNIHFIENRYESNWGSDKLVLATLACLKFIKDKFCSRHSHVILMSGLDYPIQTNKEINRFLSNNKKTNFINIEQASRCWGKAEVNRRLNKHSFFISSERGHLLTIPSIFCRTFYGDFYRNLRRVYYLLKSSKRGQFFFLFVKKKFKLEPFGGAQWFAITYETMVLVLNWVEKNPWYLKFFRTSFCSDEIFFQTIIKELDRTYSFDIKPSLTYVNRSWRGGEGPKVFTAEDLNELVAKKGEYIFCRKFDTEKNEKILDFIDDNVRQEVIKTHNF